MSWRRYAFNEVNDLALKHRTKQSPISGGKGSSGFREISNSSVDLIVGDINILDLASWWIMEGDLKILKKVRKIHFKFFPPHFIKIYLQIFARVVGEFGWDTELLGVGLPDFISAKELGLEMEVFGVGLPDLKSNETDRLLMWLWGVVWWLLGWLNGFFGVAIKIEIWKQQSLFFKEKSF